MLGQIAPRPRRKHSLPASALIAALAGLVCARPALADHLARPGQPTLDRAARDSGDGRSFATQLRLANWLTPTPGRLAAGAAGRPVALGALLMQPPPVTSPPPGPLGPPTPAEDDDDITDKWWFWAAVGGVVVTTVVLFVVASRGGTDEPRTQLGNMEVQWK